MATDFSAPADSSLVPEITTTDAQVKSKFDIVSKKYTRGIYSDETSWKPVHEMIKELQAILPSLAVVDSAYDADRPPKYKRWTCVGAFKDPKGRERAVFVTITASGAGSIEDPLDRYDLNLVYSVMSPSTVTDTKSMDYLRDLGYKVRYATDDMTGGLLMVRRDYGQKTSAEEETPDPKVVAEALRDHPELLRALQTVLDISSGKRYVTEAVAQQMMHTLRTVGVLRSVPPTKAYSPPKGVSASVIKKLDIISDRLEMHGMREAAEKLDIIANTIESTTLVDTSSFESVIKTAAKYIETEAVEEMKFPIHISENPEHPELKKVFSWLARNKMGVTFGSRPIGWYQQHQMNAIDVIEEALKKFGGTGEVRVRGGMLMGKKDGKWGNIMSCDEVYNRADEKLRNVHANQKSTL